MPAGKSPTDPQSRRRIAIAAARLIAEGAADFQAAKRKAASRLGIHDDSALPSNAEIELALREHQRLFQADRQPQALRARREAAVEAMRLLERFEPRLVGPVLDGTANEHSPVTLQLFSDAADDVGHFLAESAIPAKATSRRLRVDREHAVDFPAWTFVADGVPFELVVLPTAGLRQAPLGPVDGRPMPRATRATLRTLLDSPE